MLKLPGALPIDMSCQADASSLKSQMVDVQKLTPVLAGMGLVARPPASLPRGRA
jgi:hypothetical protein